LGERSFAEVKEAFAQQVAALVEGGVDCIMVETMSALEEAQAAIEGAKSVTNLPIVCTMTFEANLHTMMGVTPEQAALALLDWGVDVIGANCGCGPQEAEAVMRQMQQVCPQALLAVQPNAGLPRLVKERTIYDIGPEAFAEHARRFVSLGVRLIGACCGTTPAYIKAMAHVC
jgi:5-methyltetrahydrofolate--homocysteine methyltransferase